MGARRSWNFGCGDGVHYSALGAPGEARGRRDLQDRACGRMEKEVLERKGCECGMAV